MANCPFNYGVLVGFFQQAFFYSSWSSVSPWMVQLPLWNYSREHPYFIFLRAFQFSSSILEVSCKNLKHGSNSRCLHLDKRWQVQVHSHFDVIFRSRDYVASANMLFLSYSYFIKTKQTASLQEAGENRCFVSCHRTECRQRRGAGQEQSFLLYGKIPLEKSK